MKEKHGQLDHSVVHGLGELTGWIGLVHFLFLLGWVMDPKRQKHKIKNSYIHWIHRHYGHGVSWVRLGYELGRVEAIEPTDNSELDWVISKAQHLIPAHEHVGSTRRHCMRPLGVNDEFLLNSTPPRLGLCYSTDSVHRLLLHSLFSPCKGPVWLKLLIIAERLKCEYSMFCAGVNATAMHDAL